MKEVLTFQGLRRGLRLIYDRGTKDMSEVFLLDEFREKKYFNEPESIRKYRNVPPGLCRSFTSFTIVDGPGRRRTTSSASRAHTNATTIYHYRHLTLGVFPDRNSCSCEFFGGTLLQGREPTSLSLVVLRLP